MSKATVLNNVDHQDLKIDINHQKYAFDKVNRIPVCSSEIAELHKEFPLVFFKHPETNALQLHAILGIEKDENLFLGEKAWQTRYVPALLAKGPFSLGYKKPDEESNSSSDPLLCVDMDDPRVNQEEGESLFLKFGGEAPYLGYIKKVLQTIQNGLVFDKTLYTLVTTMELLEPVSIQLNVSNIEQVNFSNYYTVNQEKLSKLGAEELHQLSQYGVLSLLYFILTSASNFQYLVDLKNAKSAAL